MSWFKPWIILIVLTNWILWIHNWALASLVSRLHHQDPLSTTFSRAWSIGFYQTYISNELVVIQNGFYRSIIIWWLARSHLSRRCINSLPNGNILDSSKLRAFADDKINVHVIKKKKKIFFLGGEGFKERKLCRKCFQKSSLPGSWKQGTVR